MKPKIEFIEKKIKIADKGPENSAPSIYFSCSVQNSVTFSLSETDEIYQGYGRVPNIYPYRKYDEYTRETEEKEVFTAVLENDALRAEFLPEYGGRLWSLIDKSTGKNLIYTNDVIRPCNIAERNAWFSGGVEWNIGVIGHSPLTMEPMFTAVLEHNDVPILRMYEYERIRGVAYQMDFWLEPEGKVLNCKMRIANETDDLIPMYWWSNIAVAEHKGGRVIAPAYEAYTNKGLCICKVELPMVDGIDISKYCDIPLPVDYFFEIPQSMEKYVANLDENGYGLLHTSTDRLRSRKIFSWGNCTSADRWQEFLTDNAGRYIEIQAGLAKTQYGCIPMAPRTAWEWVEQYGAVQVEREVLSMDFADARRCMNKEAQMRNRIESPDRSLQSSKEWTKKAAKVVMRASGYADLENRRRKQNGETPVFEHLDFKSADGRTKEMIEFLETGIFPNPDPAEPPMDYVYGDAWQKLLQAEVKENAADNWYAHLQLGLMQFQKNDLERAEMEFTRSLECGESAWAHYAMANVYVQLEDKPAAIRHTLEAIKMRDSDLGFLKVCFKLLIAMGGYAQVIELYEKLPDSFKANTRLQLGKIEALYNLDKKKEAFDLLCRDGGIEVDDIAEGDDILTRLWNELRESKHDPIPQKINFQFVYTE